MVRTSVCQNSVLATIKNKTEQSRWIVFGIYLTANKININVILYRVIDLTIYLQEILCILTRETRRGHRQEKIKSAQIKYNKP
jgi:hypothetical protein